MGLGPHRASGQAGEIEIDRDEVMPPRGRLFRNFRFC